jgi:hypothetical protein
MANRFRVLILGSAALVAACTTFQPMPRASVQGGALVRARLSQLGSAQLAPSIGPTVDAIDGVVRSVSDTGVVFAMHGVLRSSGAYAEWNNEPLYVQHGQIDHYELARPSRLKSGLLATALIAAAVVIEEGFRSGGWGGRTTIHTTSGPK